ncbi:MAG: hypothetical protein EB158_04440 [Nitrosopumilaceae archaeon]|nr:hypothetical protein [Nitrosopumilaceae archaeon]
MYFGDSYRCRFSIISAKYYSSWLYYDTFRVEIVKPYFVISDLYSTKYSNAIFGFCIKKRKKEKI